jgi:pimeloyl-ACP methyl ester carboxylesterase
LSPHDFHRVCYYEWGDPDNAQVVICVHGLSRNGRDFDVLGEALAPTRRVLAIDMPGRGASACLADPNDYTFPTYLVTLTALIVRSGAERVSWVGTSMGALLSIMMAAQRTRCRASCQRCRTADRETGIHWRLPGTRSGVRVLVKRPYSPCRRRLAR